MIISYELLAILEPSLRRHEAVKNKLYKDTAGKWTIGVGRNLTDCGISDYEITVMLQNDMVRAWTDIVRLIPNIETHSIKRQAVMTEMMFNMGYKVMSGFKNTLAAFNKRDYNAVANGMLASKWATQVKSRADELAKIMKDG